MELWIEPFAVVAFFVLLASALFMLWSFYICDNDSCKVFTDAGNDAPPGSKDYVLSLLNNTFRDGIWPLPYIGATILTPLSLWFLRVPITVLNFAIVFFISFATTYFVFAFFGHHYIRPITDYTANWIEENSTITLAQAPKAKISKTRATYNDTENDEICFQAQDPVQLDQNQGSLFQQEEFEELPFDSISRDFGITFATPVNIY